MREDFLEVQKLMDAERLVFVDEAGLRLGTPPAYGWAPIGKKCFGSAPHGDWKNMTMIGAIALDGVRGIFTVDAPTTTEVFCAFINAILAPNLKAGDLVVMDNLAAHKSEAVKTAIRALGADVFFIPPYSPDFNPIEKTWSKVKTLMRRLPTLTRAAFDKALAATIECITRSDIAGWVQHAGYAIGSI
jgi:transposase